MSSSKSVLETGLAIKTATVVEEHLQTVEKATRLALDQSNEQNLAELQTLRDEIVLAQQASLESQRELIESIAALIRVLQSAEPVVVKVPQTNLTLQQQPVTVNVPKAAPVQVNPVIKVPATKVVIDKQEHAVPKRATITHSDGSTSIIKIES